MEVIEFGSDDGADDGKLDSVSLVEISEIFVTQDVFLWDWNFKNIIPHPHPE